MLKKMTTIGLPLLLIAGTSFAATHTININATPVISTASASAANSDDAKLSGISGTMGVNVNSGPAIEYGTTLPVNKTATWNITTQNGKEDHAYVLLDFTQADSNTIHPYNCEVLVHYDQANNNWVANKYHNHCSGFNDGAVIPDGGNLSFKISEQ